MTMNDFWKNKRVLVTGGAGFLGKAVVKKLLERGVKEDGIFIPRSREYDLREREAAKTVTQNKDLVIHLAATVGGIGFNKDNAGRVFYDNVMMAANLIHEAWLSSVEKFVGIGSIVEHPEFAPVPFREEGLWDGYPDKINSSYALAKRFMLAQSQFYRQQYGFNAIHLLSANLYGPGDNLDPRFSYVIPALIKKVADAKEEGKNYIEAWGTGGATREFLYVEDAAEGIVLAAEKYNGPEPINLGSGTEISIRDLTDLICRLMNFNGEIRWDVSSPAGQPRRVLDITRAKEAFGFVAKTALEDGLRKTVDWYRGR